VNQLLFGAVAGGLFGAVAGGLFGAGHRALPGAGGRVPAGVVFGLAVWATAYQGWVPL
jgi:hypothetical protein